MFTTLGIVQARFASDAAKGHMARRLGGKSLLEWVVRRVTDCQLLDQVVVAVGSGPEEQFVSELVPPDVPVFVGKASDALGSFVAALAAYPAEGVVRIGADT